jgi:hypothetical protein
MDCSQPEPLMFLTMAMVTIVGAAYSSATAAAKWE